MEGLNDDVIYLFFKYVDNHTGQRFRRTCKAINKIYVEHRKSLPGCRCKLGIEFREHEIKVNLMPFCRYALSGSYEICLTRLETAGTVSIEDFYMHASCFEYQDKIICRIRSDDPCADLKVVVEQLQEHFFFNYLKLGGIIDDTTLGAFVESFRGKKLFSDVDLYAWECEFRYRNVELWAKLLEIVRPVKLCLVRSFVRCSPFFTDEMVTSGLIDTEKITIGDRNHFDSPTTTGASSLLKTKNAGDIVITKDCIIDVKDALAKVQSWLDGDDKLFYMRVRIPPEIGPVERFLNARSEALDEDSKADICGSGLRVAMINKTGRVTSLLFKQGVNESELELTPCPFPNKWTSQVSIEGPHQLKLNHTLFI